MNTKWPTLHMTWDVVLAHKDMALEEATVSSLGNFLKGITSKGYAKKYRETIEWEIQEISSGKLEIPREHFMQRWAQ